MTRILTLAALLAMCLAAPGGADAPPWTDQLPVTFHLGGLAAGLDVSILPPTTGTDGVGGCVVAVTGTAGYFGGAPLQPGMTCIPDDDAFLCFSMAVLKDQPASPDDRVAAAHPGGRDKAIVWVSICAPLGELQDGDPDDDVIGYIFGFSPLLGWGGGPIRG